MWILWIFVYTFPSTAVPNRVYTDKLPQVAEYSSRDKCIAAGKLIQDQILYSKAVCTEK